MTLYVIDSSQLKHNLIFSVLGHGGADFFMVNAFTKAVASNDPSLISSGTIHSLRSHKLCFAAERSRINNSIETVDI